MSRRIYVPPLSTADHISYMKSWQWHGKRRRAIDEAQHRCEACWVGEEDLDGVQLCVVHQAGFDRISAEKPGDLVVICRECLHDREWKDKRCPDPHMAKMFYELRIGGLDGG